ncbi:MAG: MFS transporter, partial [Propionibacteriaceae bacterium]|nr:MFS transporter [Propionibacteriaceae bacterium]
LAAACLVALYFVERRGKRRGVDTIIDLSVLGAPSFRNGTILGTVYFTGMNSIMLIVVLLLQNGMGYTALEAGLVCAPFSVGSALVAATSGRLVARYGRPLVVGGLVVTSLGIGAMSLIAYLAGVGVQLPGGIGVWLAGVGLIAGCGSGAIISPNLTLTMQNVPPEKAGVSSSMMQLGQRLGSAIGLAVSLSVYYLVVGSGGTPANGAHWTLLITVGLFCVALGVGIFDAVQRGGGPPPSDPSKRQPAQR